MESILDQRVPSQKKEIRGVGGMAFTELWERFSFYGLQSILAFYLLYELSEGGLALPAAAAAGITGAYGGSVYLAQLLGAWAGERLISPRSMVLGGGIVIALGHITLAIAPGFVGLCSGLAMIIFGTGALKTNITSIVGFILDKEPAAKKDAGFSYFYMAINTGAVLGPLTTGFAQNEWGFHFGFGLAAVGMIIALVQYVYSSRFLPARASQVTRPLPAGSRRRAAAIALAAIVVLAAASIAGLLKAERLSTIVTVACLVAAAAYFTTILKSTKVNAFERQRVRSYLPLFLASSLYFGLLFAKFTAISLLVNDRVDLTVGGWSFPVGWITMISSASGVAMLPVAAAVWKRMGSRQPKAGTKFAIGLVHIGLGFAYILLISVAHHGSSIPFVYIVIFMFIMGSSEIFIGPIGLSLATQIAPKAFTAQMVAINFLTLALGSSLSGLLGQYFTIVSNDVYFLTIALGAVIAGLLLYAVRKPVHQGLYAGIEE
ncbi:oligopeptide:H+ symporter [Brevibacterium sp. ZH18]|uniref:peptide MFS transporter n=1 Tax=Brevibacterium sp. ZH18 TaxID=2927784 RepID=UPI001F619CB7|nr:oligopeptide:H+ symporter [Brevibacterium sp. ZH18]MCI4012972.1 oligopeptide:H+ symporter [Brevibacterium sp. ZH18]